MSKQLCRPPAPPQTAAPVIIFRTIVDTSSWYSLFCVFFLRINSIINPIGIYDESIFKWLRSFTLMCKYRIEEGWLYFKNLVDHKDIMNQTGQAIEMVELPPGHLKKQ